MKRNIFLVTLALAACVFVSAQDSRPGSRGGGAAPPRTRPAVEEVSVSGTLGLEKGAIVLTAGSATYYVPSLLRYAGFIEGLKEGAKVSVKGEVFTVSSENAKSAPKTLNVTRLTIGGKEYDLSSQGGGDFPPGGGPPGGGPR